MKNIYSSLNVYEKRTAKSKVVTQLLYGDTFKILNYKNKWTKIKNDIDNYKGYIKSKNFIKNKLANYKVSTLFASLYSKPKKKYKLKKKLSYGSKLKIIDKKNNFYKFDKFWIIKRNLKKIKHVDKNVFKDIKKFVNVKYKWGGKNYKGIDCSALVQIFLNYNNKFCPRDTVDQVKYFKKSIKLENIKKNDLIFWKGHVAIALSKKKLIHAYGPLKKVIIMPINKTIERIYKTAGLKVIAIKRI